MFKRTKLSGAVVAAIASMTCAPQLFAQEGAALEEVTVTGIRASMERAMDIKRDSAGVVDAISAEDMGKFPDTNLAESLQRISGVSINRVNGEGSEITVRGFGPSFNLVTLNGRQMPTTNVTTVGGDQDSDWKSGTGRSFDFSNLASEGVSGLEVYKTGRASSPTGGIGATVNINTVRPLDNPGIQASVGVKGMHDTGVNFDGDDFTPETSGLFSWTNEEETFGVALFGSYQERHGGTRSATVNDWDIRTGASINDGSSEFVGNDTVINNAPADDQLVAIPKDSRYHVSSNERERTNAQLTMQFRPREDLTLTADALYANNEQLEQRTDQGNWFNAIRSEMTFDGNSTVATPLYQYQDIPGDVKDLGFEQQLRSSEDELQSFGFNAEWDASDDLSFSFDAHTSKSESNPNGPLGTSSILFGIGAFVVDAHSLDVSSGFPVADIVFNDDHFNGNGQIDANELSTSVARTATSSQEHQIDQFSLDGSWEFDNGRIDFGLSSIGSEMTQQKMQTTQSLGGWGNRTPDIPADLVEAFCMTCMFDDYNPGSAGLTAYRGNAGELLMALAGPWSEDEIDTREYNMVEEDILSAYFQFTLEGQLGNFPTQLVIGTRFEETDTKSTSLVAVPQNIIWKSDNDFGRTLTGEQMPVSLSGKYNNLLPSLDFSIDLRQDLKGRVSYSKTIARPDYGHLFASTTASNPSGPIALGAVPGGSRGNPGLLPLESDNFDLSVEWYYGDSSYVSAGFYEKRVANFIGDGKFSESLFDLRDPTSGAAGSRSGDALAALDEMGVDASEAHLFTLTALIDNFGIESAKTMFESELVDGNLPQGYIDEILTEYDVVADSSDPLFMFDVAVPVNNREAKIHGFELAAQHFFGETGFGLQANLTTVRGDVGYDNGADPADTQFALLGLSDSANLAVIYENFGVSARLAYNWRDQFLSQVNRGASNNPVYVDEYGQLDVNISYEVTDNFTVLFEGLNLTEESMKTFARDENNVWFAQELDARYLIGAQYKF
ncbi:TonB-dependent receptor [Microbulbifer bruguierae]|uniref:TonB-dependent receptor n=1 Tax=Microbulbifer bruguierae TaxID=3029061 RepID=A0ABY8NI25_9GAMM|nr:TonB-dependent receptor [Microbulbifer bruguierae]WGL18355.1 TonB-dependent receptor [Microbulbifer bruguierae]